MDKKSLAQKKLWILDMDGTVYLGNQLFPETVETFRILGALGTPNV